MLDLVGKAQFFVYLLASQYIEYRRVNLRNTGGNMSIKGFLHRIVRGGGHPEKEAMKYCFDHGFRAGKTSNTTADTRLIPTGHG